MLSFILDVFEIYKPFWFFRTGESQFHILLLIQVYTLPAPRSQRNHNIGGLRKLYNGTLLLVGVEQGEWERNKQHSCPPSQLPAAVLQPTGVDYFHSLSVGFSSATFKRALPCTGDRGVRRLCRVWSLIWHRNAHYISFLCAMTSGEEEYKNSAVEKDYPAKSCIYEFIFI